MSCPESADSLRSHPAQLLARIICIAFLFCSGIALGQQAVAPAHFRVLFIGNSYTYFNNLPEMFAKLAESGKRGPVDVEMVAPGGYRLKDHWEKGKAREVLHDGKWDYVVLQDQSTLGVTYWVEGKAHVTSDVIFHPYALMWAEEVRKAGATPTFFLTWAGKDTPEDQPALNDAYTRAAKESQSRVAPVGVAWQQVRQQNPALSLFYVGRGSHPSVEGSYLAACALYATIFESSPVGLPGKIDGHPVNLDTEKVESDKTTVLVDLNANVAAALQNAAWNAFEQQRKNGGYLNTQHALTPIIPPLPSAEALSAQSLEGYWAGKILFYPVGPVDMALQFHHEPDWNVKLELRYHSKDFPDESLNVSDLYLGNDEFTFSDPKSAGVDNLAVRFRGVLGADGKLHGTAESVTAVGDPPVRVIGDWLLEKK